MSYNVLLHPNAIKFLRKLPKKDVERIKAKLSELVNPHSVKAIKLKNKGTGLELAITESSTRLMIVRRSLLFLKSITGKGFTIECSILGSPTKISLLSFNT